MPLITFIIAQKRLKKKHSIFGDHHNFRPFLLYGPSPPAGRIKIHNPYRDVIVNLVASLHLERATETKECHPLDRRTPTLAASSAALIATTTATETISSLLLLS